MAFPVSADGRRSTSALGQAVVADALSGVDPTGARAAERESKWRTAYPVHFRRLVEAGLASRQATVSVARDGLESLHQRMRFIGHDGTETGLGALASAPARGKLTAVEVTGTGTAESELSVPYRGERLRGDALAARLEAWTAAGVIEPSCADAVRTVAAHPEWLALPGRTAVVLGAGAEIGPLPVLLSWGARVIGVDLARPAVWAPVLETGPGQRGDTAGPGDRGRRPGPRAAGWAGPDRRHPGRGRLARRGRRPAGAGQLRLRRRGGQRAAGRRGRRTDRAPERRAGRCGARLPGHADRCVRGPGRRGGPVGPRVRHPVPGGEDGQLAASGRLRPGGCCTAPTRPAPTPASATA